MRKVEARNEIIRIRLSKSELKMLNCLVDDSSFSSYSELIRKALIYYAANGQHEIEEVRKEARKLIIIEKMHNIIKIGTRLSYAMEKVKEVRMKLALANRKDLIKEFEKLQTELLKLDGYSKRQIKEIMKKEKVIITHSVDRAVISDKKVSKL